MLEKSPATDSTAADSISTAADSISTAADSIAIEDFALRQFYDSEAQQWQGSIRTSNYYSARSFRVLQRHVLGLISPAPGQKILDAGCGVGLFGEPLTHNNLVYGVDFSVASLSFARRHGLRVACSGVDALPFPSDSFDTVLCVGVLQHIADYATVIRELQRVVRPGGAVVLATINRHALQRTIAALISRRVLAAQLRAYTVGEITTVYKACGLHDITVLNVYYPLSFATRRQRVGQLQKYFSSTFVIRGRKAKT